MVYTQMCVYYIYLVALSIPPDYGGYKFVKISTKLKDNLIEKLIDFAIGNKRILVTKCFSILFYLF